MTMMFRVIKRSPLDPKRQRAAVSSSLELSGGVGRLSPVVTISITAEALAGLAAARQANDDIAVGLTLAAQGREPVKRMAIECDLETAALVESRLRPHAVRQRRAYGRVRSKPRPGRMSAKRRTFDHDEACAL
jgi:hypothetical protein